MSEEAQLHLKYRPRRLEEVVGNERTVAALQSVLRRSAPPRTYLLTGPVGCGKTTLGRIIAGELGCSGRDFREMNSANYRGVDHVRLIQSLARYRPFKGKYQVWLLDECHQLTNDAQNILLKTLEEPPARAVFILATSQPEDLISSIRSRCHRFTVSRLSAETILPYLEWVCGQERPDSNHLTNRLLSRVAATSRGSLRDALITLDQVLDLEDEAVALALLTDSSPDITLDVSRPPSRRRSTTKELPRHLIAALQPVAAEYFRNLLRVAEIDADESGWISRSQSQIERDLGIGRTRQRSARRRLVELGLIEERRERRGAKAQYRIRNDRLK